MNKPSSLQPLPSRQQILSWIYSLLNDIALSFKIEQLGKGVIYCRILNHYFPGVITINRIIWHPKSQYQNMLNLRILQNAFSQLKINLPLDPIKLSKEKLHDNWAFVTTFYKYLTPNHEEQLQTPQQDIKSSTFYPLGPKRTLDQVYPQQFYQKTAKQPFHAIENTLQKNIYNASKYSVGKLYKEPTMAQMNNSPNKGKWSVNSHMFQNNLVPIIDRIKQILLKSSHDTEKIRQVKLLLNIPLNEQVVVKVEQDENSQIIKIDSSSAEATERNEKWKADTQKQQIQATKTEIN